MNSDLYIEFASRSGEFHFRQRLLALPATVGRSLANDFVLDDPYVAASHLEISADPEAPGELLIRDLDSRNGLYLNEQRVRQTRLKPGQVLRFGHTTLRLRTPQDPVEPERVDAFASRAFSLDAGLLALLLITCIALLQKPLNQFTEISAKEWMVAVLSPLGAVIIWASLWAMLTRLFSGRAQFGAHLAITAWSMLGIELVSQALGLAAYALSWATLAQLSTPASILVAVWALFRQLSLAQLRWPRVNLPLALLLMALPTSLWVMSNWESRRGLLGDNLVGTLHLPAARIVRGSSEAQFIERIATLQADIDAQAKADKEEAAAEDPELDDE